MEYPVRSLPELLSFLDGQIEPRIVMDANYRIVAANKAYAQEFARDHPVEGRYCYEVSHHFDVPCDQAGESCPLRLSQASGRVQRVLHLHYTSRGEEHVDVETTPLRDEHGKVAYFVETMRVVKQASSRPAAEGLVGRSAAFNAMLAQVMRVAPTWANVLLLGETGTGKELLAQLIHEAGPCPAGPFVTVDCSGLTETLFESELFGYEKGAFTGAAHRKIGLIEAADGGTLFLDEVGDIPLPIQVKLLRLLENGTFRRVGGVETMRSEFRLICATHRDIEAMTRDERFRSDLFHRISTFPVFVPSLSERNDDIPLLADSFLKRVAGERDLHMTAEALAALKSRHYAGNIRELRNVIERATILTDGEMIEPEHFTASAFARQDAPAQAAKTGKSAFVVEKPISLAELERRYVRWVAERLPNDRSAQAAALELGRRTFYRKLKSSGD
ncbi:MAG: sigma-54-dependent Fis family transcriptional regulator [Gammaproteobacteria bacterium]|nr:sigma-54-dependent Fis family transcriptional regulator [Gammaproteobacteria bacterium]MBU1416122.1 sigma-54-dependent Fis family transcriptional regulator [Gammaproteobacteria bacterium]